jgi:uncharacterized protein YbbC (DUF1343 family)
MLRCGAEVAYTGGFHQFQGQRVAVVANPTSLIRFGRRRIHLIDALRSAGIAVVRLFGPEHGIWATAQDMIGVDSGVDPVFSLPVQTLYGHDADSLALRPHALDGVDTLIFDVADVGARYYTYAATLVMAIEAAAARGVRVVVLDRPNPLGGVVVEGNAVDLTRFRSFVGWIDVPQRHGLTVGEIAGLYVAEAGLQVDLQIVDVVGWQIERYLDAQPCGDGDAALPALWTPPSPNMPTVETAVVYPGMCLIEATTLSEGRGTTRPFEVVGAPGIPARAFADALLRRLDGVVDARPLRFEPAFQKHGARVCDGVALEVIDRGRLDAVRLGLHVIAAAREVAVDAFGWRAEAYEFVADRQAIDLLMGGPMAREGIERGAPMSEITADFAAAEARFARRVAPYLRHRRPHGLLAGPVGSP